MIELSSPEPNRRDFLTGRAVLSQVERAGGAIADAVVSSEINPTPAGGSTVRLGTRAMACDFSVILNPGPGDQVMAASDAALDLVHVLEDQMTVYRPHSEMSRLNRRAAFEPVEVEARLFQLLTRAREVCIETSGAFDPTSGPLIEIWRQCRREGRIPNQAEINFRLEKTGIGHVSFDAETRQIRFDCEGVELNLGAIGKGHALDRAANVLNDYSVENWLLHGGHSSILAKGEHNGTGGWPVGIRHPLFSRRRFATLLLKNAAMSTSGSGVQYFRHGGRRYGHILDPRTGWPVEGMLSVSVVAPTAAESDALSTAFFVAGVEKAIDYCHNHEGVGALIIPPPRRGMTLEPVVCGIAGEALFFASP